MWGLMEKHVARWCGMLALCVVFYAQPPHARREEGVGRLWINDMCGGVSFTHNTPPYCHLSLALLVRS